MTRIETVARFGLAVLALVVTMAYVVEATTFRPLARHAPMTVGLIAITVLCVLTVHEGRRMVALSRAQAAASGEEVTGGAADERVIDIREVFTGQDLRRAARYAGLVVALVGAVALVGLKVAGPVYVFLSLRFMARSKLVGSGLGAVATLGLLLIIERYLGVAWPPPLGWWA